MALPHIKNSKAGINREEPMYGNLFEVYFSIPAALQGEVGAEDVNVLTEQVTKIDGLDTLTKSLIIIYSNVLRHGISSGTT